MSHRYANIATPVPQANLVALTCLPFIGRSTEK